MQLARFIVIPLSFLALTAGALAQNGVDDAPQKVAPNEIPAGDNPPPARDVVPPDELISNELLKEQEDARTYLEMVDILKDAPAQDQISGWEKFLKSHPESYFKEEIQNNLDNLKANLALKEKARQEEDSRLYFRTVEQAIKLPLGEQVVLWERYLRDHPDSFFANNALTTLNRLREENKWESGEVRTPANRNSVPRSEVPAPQKKPVPAPVKKNDSVSSSLKRDADPKYLDPDRAFFLAAVPGLVVPGLGHFYVGKHGMGAFLAVLRVGGLAMLGLGLYKSNSVYVVPGFLLAGVSYAIDVIVAPIEAREFNYSLDPLPPLDEDKLPSSGMPDAESKQLAFVLPVMRF